MDCEFIAVNYNNRRVVMMIEYHLNEHEWSRIEREKGKHVHYYSRHHVLLGESSLGWSFAVATLSLVFFTLHLSARPSLFFYFFTVKHYLIFILRVLPLCLSLCFEEMCRTRDRNRSSPIGNFLRPFCQKDYVECNSIVEIELFFSLFPCTKCLSILIWRSIEWLSAFRRRVVRNESVIFFFLFLVV